MTHPDGTQIGADGRRYAPELIADVLAPPPRHDGWYATFLPMRQRTGNVSLAPIFVADRSVARLTLSVPDLTGGGNAKTVVTVTGATGGTFTLEIDARQRIFHVTFPYNVTPSAFKTLVESAISDTGNVPLGANTVTVTGSVGNYTVEFIGAAGSQPASMDPDADATALTGTSPTVTTDRSSDGLSVGFWPQLGITLSSSASNEVDEDGAFVNATSTGANNQTTTVSKASMTEGQIYTRRIVISPLDEWVQFSYSLGDGTGTFSLRGEIV